MSARLSLHVPEPSVRPGGRPDFSHVSVPEAGEVPRPPIDVSPAEIRDFAYSMIRVLDDKGEAVGDWAGALSAEELRKGLRDMMLTRAFDARMLLSQRQGKTSFYITCLGEEAVATAHRKALAPGDMCFPTYRQQGLLIAAGWPLVDMMCEIFSNEKDRLKGRQLPGSIRRRRPASSPSPAISARNIPRPSAGRWPRRSRATRRSPRAGSATARRRRPTSIRRWCSPPSTGRRSSSTSSTTSGRSRPTRASPAARAPNSPPARMASASPRCGSTATTISPSTPSRNGRSSGRAPIWGRPSSNGSPTAPAPIRPRTIRRNTGPRTNGLPGRSAIRSRG